LRFIFPLFPSFYLHLVSYASAKHEDCEKPPEVENASVLVAYDESEEFVTATYRCHDGYKLHGKSAITCDLDTDEWQENPPRCEPSEYKKFLFLLRVEKIKIFSMNI
jgi:hypothetical protein